MLNERDMKQAFGEADARFEHAVYQSLAQLNRNGGNMPMKRKPIRAAIAVAAACIILTTTALAVAGRWGVLDFINSRGAVVVLPAASEVIQEDVPQTNAQTDAVAFSVREAVLDEAYTYIVVEAKPANEKLFLLGADADPDDPVSDMGPLYADTAGTIADYAAANQKEMIRVSMRGGETEQGTLVIDTLDYLLEEDGTLVYMVKGTYTGGGDAPAISLACVTYAFRGETLDLESRRDTTLSFTLDAPAAQSVMTSTETQVYADCGVRIDKVTLTGSPMAVYAEIEFTVIDEALYAATDGGLLFEFLDENGERVPDGAADIGGVTPLDDGQTRFLQRASLQAVESLPETVTLRGFNCWEKNRYETHTFTMQS